MAAVDNRTLVKRSAYTMRTGSPAVREKEKVYLLKHKLVGTECLSCTHFFGNYKGRFSKGVPAEPGHGCLGVSKGLCLYFDKEEGFCLQWQNKLLYMNMQECVIIRNGGL